MRVYVLLCTYNGAEFLEKQLDSILGQTHNDVMIVIRDDCSTDGTPEIIERYEKLNSSRIVIKNRKTNSGKPQVNFLEGLMEVRALMEESDCVMLSDQDDFWFPTKIEEYLTYYASSVADKDRPVLLFSDLIIANDQLQSTGNLFNKQKHIKVQMPIKLHKILLQNLVTGCTIFMNLPLLKYFNSIPECTMHDHWIALVAAICGDIHFLPKPMMLYRIHQENVRGNKKPYTVKKLMRKIFNPVDPYLDNQFFKQAQALSEIFSPHLGHEDKQVLAAYLNFPNLGKYARIKIAMRMDMLSDNLLSALVQVFSI